MINEAVAVATDFDNFIRQLKAQNIRIGSDYSDSAIRKRIEIRLRPEASKAYRAEQKKISRAAMTTAFASACTALVFIRVPANLVNSDYINEL